MKKFILICLSPLMILGQDWTNESVFDIMTPKSKKYNNEIICSLQKRF